MNELKSIVLKQYSERFDYNKSEEKSIVNKESHPNTISPNYEESNIWSTLHEVTEEGNFWYFDNLI